MFLGWYDPDRKKPAHKKLREAIERYHEKFERTPRYCLTSPLDGAELEQQPATGIEVQTRSYIARWTFYIGEDLGQAAMADTTV